MPALSCAFAPGPATPQHIALAEELGYSRAWCYDSPAFYSDVWVTLALAAERTGSIGLGPAVAVPSLRHPAVTAAALHGLSVQAPGRVAATFGTGFTGRRALGQGRLGWAQVAAYVRCVRGLLAGETVLWDGARTALLERDPVTLPLLLAADGPRGRAIAAEIADGMFCSSPPEPSPELPPELPTELPQWRALMTFGTVLDEGEPLTSPRVLAAAGPALAVIYHSLYDTSPAAVDGLPGGAAWRSALEQLPEDERHLALHEGHLLRVNARDTGIVQEGAALLPTLTFTGTADQLRERTAQLAAGGITEVVVQPAGDVEAELRRFAALLA